MIHRDLAFAQDQLDLILRRDEVSVEAIYLSRRAAVHAAAALAESSLMDKTPSVKLKVAGSELQDELAD